MIDPALDKKIVEAFVLRNVKCEVTNLINFLLDNIERLNDCPVDFEPVTVTGDPRCPACDSPLNDNQYRSYYCHACGETFFEDEVIFDFDTPSHWFIVTSSLATDLEEAGEIVLNNKYWGREGSWRGLIHDPIIMDICEQRQLLSGQKECVHIASND